MTPSTGGRDGHILITSWVNELTGWVAASVGHPEGVGNQSHEGKLWIYGKIHEGNDSILPL